MALRLCSHLRTELQTSQLRTVDQLLAQLKELRRPLSLQELQLQLL
jgi:hypothetical protein